MFEVNVIGAEQVVSNFKGAREDFKKAKKYKMTDAVKFIKNYIKQKELSGQILKKRSGWLRKSIASKINFVGDNVVGRVFPRVGGKFPPYGYIHETGKTIQPKKSSYLKIPLKSEWQTLENRKLYPKKEETYIQKSKKGNLIVFSRDTKEPLFVLKKVVKIPARPYMEPASRNTRREVYKILGEAVGIFVRRANGT